MDPISKRIYDQLLNGQTSGREPVTSSFPVPYHWVPGEIRIRLAKLLFRPYVEAMRRERQRHPASYADDTVDHWLRQSSPPVGEGCGWAWPGGKRCALILSHDTDTDGQERGINMLRAVAESRGIRSTFSFVGRYLSSYSPMILELSDAGASIALHDVVHDNRIAFLPEKAILERLSPIMDEARRLAVTGFRSPSWYTAPQLWSALGKLDFLYDMSALDSWPFFDPSRNYGVCTFFPFIVDSLVILPNTIPFEMPWSCGYRLRETLEFWKPKFDRIADSGGMIMLNAHPDRWYCGNRRAIEELERCVDYILERHDPAKMQAGDVAQHTLSMRTAGSMIELPGTQPVHVPLHEHQFSSASEEGTHMRNPCTSTPREFLSGQT